MHRLLSKLKEAGSNDGRRREETRDRTAASTNGAPPPRVRRSLNEAAHKLQR
jgi:hypothetical protein